MVINTNNLLGLLGFLALLGVESTLQVFLEIKGTLEFFLILEVLLPSHSWVPGLAG